MNYIISIVQDKVCIIDRRTRKDCTDDLVRYIFGGYAKMPERSYEMIKELYDFTNDWEIDHTEVRRKA